MNCEIGVLLEDLSGLGGEVLAVCLNVFKFYFLDELDSLF